MTKFNARKRTQQPIALDPAGTEVATRVADVLLMFTKGSSTIGVSEIARELGLSKAVVHRILQSLVSRALVQVTPDTREYELGPGAIAFGARAMRDLDVRHTARPMLRYLRDLTRESVTLSALVHDSRIYLDQYESPQEIKMTVALGRPYPLYAGASSRAILAFLPDENLQRIIAVGLERLTPETIVDASELRRQLTAVRSAGFATSYGERQHGAGSVAAPIFGMDEEIIGSISACGPVTRFDGETVARYAPLVCSAAEEISRSLGRGG
jgi:IclR family acetate operon transcriptional repressor